MAKFAYDGAAALNKKLQSSATHMCALCTQTRIYVAMIENDAIKTALCHCHHQGKYVPGVMGRCLKKGAKFYQNFSNVLYLCIYII